MNNGMQHIHARRRIYKHLEPFPSRKAFKRFLDYLMYAVGLVQWVALVPQIVSIYFYDHVSGISISTWMLLAFFNLLWALYGYAHQDRPVLFSSFLMGLGDLAIIIGVLAQ